MKSFRTLLKIIFGRKSGESYRVILFYSCFISFTICLSLFLNIFTFSRNFFGNNTILVFSTLFTSTIVSSSDSFNVIVRTAFQMVISCFIGDIVAYISVVIFLNEIWVTIFIYLAFLLFTSGFLLSSKNLPWSISKRMYFEYFLLVYVIKPTNRSPIIFLKSALASIFTMIFALIGCFIMNPFFSSELYLRTAAKIIHRSHQCTKLLGRQLEIKTMSELKTPLERRAHKKILYDINSRLSQSKTNIPVFFRDSNNNNKLITYNDNSNNSSIKSETATDSKIRKSIQKYLNTFQYLKLSKSSNSNNNKNNDNINNNNFNLNISHNSPSTLRNKRDIIIDNPIEVINNYKNELAQINVKYALDLNRLERYFGESKMEFWNKDLVSHFKELSIYLEKNHNVINSMQILIEKDLSNKRYKLLLPLIPHINSIIHLSNNISIIMENQLLGNYRTNKIKNKIKSILKRLFNNKQQQQYNSFKDYSSDQRYNNSYQFGNNQKDNSSSISSSSTGDEENQMNEKERYKKTLEYSQNRIIKYFERIDILIEVLTDEYHKVEVLKELLEFDKESQCELSRIHFFLNLLCSYVTLQKRLSNLVLSCSKCLYRQNQIYHLEMFILIIQWFINLPSYYWIRMKLFIRNFKDGRYFNQKQQSSDNILKPNFTTKEKIKLFTNNILSRLLFKWKFSLKFSILISVITIAYYEITIHSNFVLFRALTWYIIPILYVSAPSIGSSGFSCFMRFFGTLFGVFSAYTVGVLFSLTNHDGTKALCYVALTFVIMAFINFVARGKAIQSFGNFFILAYATITFPEFTQDQALILNALLRWFDISLAVFTIMAVSFILPYYDHKELELNLLDIAAKELKSFKKIITYHFNLNILEIQNHFNDNSNINNNNNNGNESICQHISSNFQNNQNSIPDDISVCSTFYSADYNKTIPTIDKSTFKDILWPMFHNIRSRITQQRSLLFQSRFELLFQKKKFLHLKDLLNSIAVQYRILVSLEYIIFENDFNNNKYDSYFLDQVRLTIIPKLKYIVSELDYSAESLIEIRNLKIDNFNNRPVVFPTNLKVLMEEVYSDYHSLVYYNSCDVEHSFTIHQLGCLLYAFDLFITNHQNINNHIWILTNAIKVERGDLISNFNPLKLALENLNSIYNNSNNINSNSNDNSSMGSGYRSNQNSSNNYSSVHSSSKSDLSSNLSSTSSTSSFDDIDMFIPCSRDSKGPNNRFNKSK